MGIELGVGVISESRLSSGLIRIYIATFSAIRSSGNLSGRQAGALKVRALCEQPIGRETRRMMTPNRILTTSRPVLTQHPDLVSTGLLVARLRFAVVVRRVSWPRGSSQSTGLCEHPDFVSIYIHT